MNVNSMMERGKIEDGFLNFVRNMRKIFFKNNLINFEKYFHKFSNINNFINYYFFFNTFCPAT